MSPQFIHLLIANGNKELISVEILYTLLISKSRKENLFSPILLLSPSYYVLYNRTSIGSFLRAPRSPDCQSAKECSYLKLVSNKLFLMHNAYTIRNTLRKICLEIRCFNLMFLSFQNWIDFY